MSETNYDPYAAPASSASPDTVRAARSRCRRCR